MDLRGPTSNGRGYREGKGEEGGEGRVRKEEEGRVRREERERSGPPCVSLNFP